MSARDQYNVQRTQFISYFLWCTHKIHRCKLGFPDFVCEYYYYERAVSQYISKCYNCLVGPLSSLAITHTPLKRLAICKNYMCASYIIGNDHAISASTTMTEPDLEWEGIEMEALARETIPQLHA